MEERKLICLGTARVWNMPEVAIAAGWLPYPVSTVSEAMEVYKSQHPLVGLILLDKFGTDDHADRDVELLLAQVVEQSRLLVAAAQTC